ncbi:hypothetical protein ACFX14_024997 [Malus domestica]
MEFPQFFLMAVSTLGFRERDEPRRNRKVKKQPEKLNILAPCSSIENICHPIFFFPENRQRVSLEKFLDKRVFDLFDLFGKERREPGSGGAKPEPPLIWVVHFAAMGVESSVRQLACCVTCR